MASPLHLFAISKRMELKAWDRKIMTYLEELFTMVMFLFWSKIRVVKVHPSIFFIEVELYFVVNT